MSTESYYQVKHEEKGEFVVSEQITDFWELQEYLNFLEGKGIRSIESFRYESNKLVKSANFILNDKNMWEKL